jgi:hypothetical protein
VNAIFKVWDASIPTQRAAWASLWNQWPDREVSAHPGYGELFAGAEDAVKCASFVGTDGSSVMFPFIERIISGSRPSRGSEPILRDIITPYGYGGPFAWDLTDRDRVAAKFWAEFDAWQTDENIVTEFIRFGLVPEAFLPYPPGKTPRTTNIVRSLDLDDDAMFMSFEQKVRKNVKKAVRNGLTVTLDDTGEFVSEFMRLYVSTMQRRGADAGYFFPPEFFESIHRNLDGQFAYFHVQHHSRIVSTELVLVSERSVYSFLGGTDDSAFDLRPNDLLKHEIIRWARSNGKSSFVLGGGATPGDGIERYKRSLAPDGAVDFFTGQRVLQPEIYGDLVRDRKKQFANADVEWPESSTYFPEYRMPF